MVGTDEPRRLLAISSSGGHWEQLLQLRESFEGLEVHYAVTLKGLAERAGIADGVLVPDFNAQQPIKTALGAMKVVALVWRLRPNVIVSTGAAPGLVALAAGKLIGARTIWIDSIANAQTLSLSGRLARWVADLWLTQWSHLAKPDGPQYLGAVL
jgi:UDP-N-acetylglucosamine:LPS N-acetylglucosamine transferase